MDTLPEEEILLNIFHRLPIKSLGMCICVNKYWLSLIKNPNFIASNTKIRNINNQYLTLWRNDIPSTRCELYRDHDKNRFDFYKRIILPFDEEDLYGGDLEQSISICNGLLCFIKHIDTVILWNPTIEKMLTLPEPTIIPIDWDEDGDYFQTVALGCDSLTNDYKVIRFITEFYPDGLSLYKVEIFSLNSNSWKIISEICPAFDIKGPSFPILNGTLNWIGYAGPENRWYSILGFDVNEEVFRIIDLPIVLRNSGIRCDLATYNKETSVAIGVHYSVNKVIEVWVMKEYGNVESWAKIWVDKEFQLLQPFIAMGPFITGLLNNGEVLVEMLFLMDLEEDANHAFMAIDPESKSGRTERYICGHESSYKFGIDHRYFEESLVLLDNVNAINSLEDIDDD